MGGAPRRFATHRSSYIAFVTMATALARVAIAGFGQLSVRPQRALRVKAPEDARVDALRVRVGFDPDEHVFAAQRRTEVRTIRIQVVKFSHNDLQGVRCQVSGVRSRTLFRPMPLGANLKPET